jgi:hypothetical protein
MAYPVRKKLSGDIPDGVKGALIQAHNGVWLQCVPCNEIPLAYWEKFKCAWVTNNRRPSAPNEGGINFHNAYTRAMSSYLAWIVCDVQDWGEECP